MDVCHFCPSFNKLKTETDLYPNRDPCYTWSHTAHNKQIKKGDNVAYFHGSPTCTKSPFFFPGLRWVVIPVVQRGDLTNTKAQIERERDTHTRKREREFIKEEGHNAYKLSSIRISSASAI